MNKNCSNPFGCVCDPIEFDDCPCNKNRIDMKYFTVLTAKQIDQIWYNGDCMLSCFPSGEQFQFFVQCRKDGTPRTDGKACYYRPDEMINLKYDYKIVKPNIQDISPNPRNKERATT